MAKVTVNSNLTENYTAKVSYGTFVYKNRNVCIVDYNQNLVILENGDKYSEDAAKTFDSVIPKGTIIIIEV